MPELRQWIARYIYNSMNKYPFTMTQRQHNTRLNIWIISGVAVLIILLLLWLTVADFIGDTDVAATVIPVANF